MNIKTPLQQYARFEFNLDKVLAYHYMTLNILNIGLSLCLCTTSRM